MQFKHPELLYALILLLIPIIVHLFQLRRFQKVAFTNVKFLKTIAIQTRKSSQLKKWLTLITRLLLLACIILAFAQPYFSKLKSIETNSETVIFLDNSFSMQAKGAQGELLKRSIQDILESMSDSDKLTLFTNDNTFIEASRKTLSNELLSLNYSATQLDYNAAVIKGSQLFSNDAGSLKNLILISDFQQQNKEFSGTTDMNTTLIPLKPVNTNNISIDSVYISSSNPTTHEISALINSNGTDVTNLSVSLFQEDQLVAKSAVSENTSTAIFTIPNNEVFNGRISIDDPNLSFDNDLYFNINKPEKINVLSINATEENYLKRIFSKEEFIYTSVAFEQLNYNDIEQQNLIVLNELDNIPMSFSNALNSFLDKGGYLLIIPSGNINISSYNQLINNVNPLRVSDKKITTITYSHPIFNGVFDQQVSNFQYPKVNSYYPIQSGSSVLQLEDNMPFIVQQNNVYIVSASLQENNSNFVNSPLIVPTLYNIGRQSLQIPKLYYSIGNYNTFDVSIALQQDQILKLKKDTQELIPQQRTYSNKVSINTQETPNSSGVYDVINNSAVFKRVSYNFNRSESVLNYMDLTSVKNATISNSIPQTFENIKNDSNVNELWKWFTIFALILLVIEMLILKYFK